MGIFASSSRATLENDALKRYIAQIKIDKNNPGLLFKWDSEVVSMFVQQANIKLSKSRVGKPEVPYFWIPRGKKLTSELLMIGIIDYLKKIGSGKSYGTVLIAPNTMTQFFSSLQRLVFVQNDDFMQEIMQDVKQSLGIEEDSLMSSLYLANGRGKHAYF